MAMASSGSTNNYIETNPIKPVNEAVQEYRVIEDGALAQHLQEREIEYHLALNVQQRKTVMEDIKAAKMLQDEEDKKARILTIDEQEQIKYQDEKFAEVIQSDIVESHIKEEEEKRELEAQDSEIALRIRERDKYYEQKQAERDRRLAEKLNKIDLSEGRRKEVSDEDLAWQLQEEERRKLKHKKQSRTHMKAVIEMQDEELARYIHEKDMEEAEMMRRHDHDGKKHRKSRKMPHPEEPHSSRPRSPEYYSRKEDRGHRPPHRPPPPRQLSDYSHDDSRRSRDREIAPSSEEDYLVENRSVSPRSKKLSKNDVRMHHAPQRPPPPRNADDYLYEKPEPRSNRPKERLPRNDDHHVERSYRERTRLPTRPSSSHSSDPPTPPRSRRRNSSDLLESNSSRAQSSRSQADSNLPPKERHGEEALDNPWDRFPNSSPKHYKNPQESEDVAYGDGLKRLEEQEFGKQDPNPRQDKKKKSNKGDCKQQ